MSVSELRSDFIPTIVYSEGKSIVKGFKADPSRYSREQRSILETGMFLNLSICNAGVDNQVASLSRGLVWDRETPVREMLTSIIEDIGGKRVVEEDWTGDHSLAVTYELDEVDLNKLIIRFVYSPARRYQEYMSHLADLAALSDKEHGRSILTGLSPKGKTLKSIVEGEQTELIRAHQKGSGAGFVWNSIKTINQEGEEDWVALPPEGDDLYWVRKLATSSDTEAEISHNILGGIDYFKGDSDKIRIRISAFFDDSVECCVNCSAVQYCKSASFETGAHQIQEGGSRLLPNLYGFMVELSQKKCPDCHEKISSSESHICKYES